MSDIIAIGIATAFLIAGILLVNAIHHEMKKAQKIWGEKRRYKNMKGKPCPYTIKPLTCQEGWCAECPIYINKKNLEFFTPDTYKKIC